MMRSDKKEVQDAQFVVSTSDFSKIGLVATRNFKMKYKLSELNIFNKGKSQNRSPN